MLRLSPYIYVAPAVFNHGSVEYIHFLWTGIRSVLIIVKNVVTAPFSSRKASTCIVLSVVVVVSSLKLLKFIMPMSFGSNGTSSSP